MTERRRIRPAGVLVILVVDAMLVMVFALVGRSTHAEGLDAAGVWGTASPFLAGLAVGWLVALGWRHPLTVWPTGIVVWAGTLVVGMLLRVASGQGTALAFIIVAALTLAVLLIGWRSAALLVGRATRERVEAGAR
jgi:hypothetical protein